MLAHKAVHRGHVAAEAAHGEKALYFDARQIPSVAYTDPEVAWAGVTEDPSQSGKVWNYALMFPWRLGSRDRQRT